MTHTPVLDHGYIRLIDSMGDDKSIVNAARVSFDKEIDQLDSKDERLLKYLIEHHHWSPFRTGVLSFEVYAPLFVARQWWKHAVASSHVDEQLQWNESSRRYVTEEPVFYTPTTWRKQSTDKKQGSAGTVTKRTAYDVSHEYEELVEAALSIYNNMLARGVAIEQARIVLPQSIYVRWRWTVSLQALLNWLQLRSSSDAQQEHAAYTTAVRKHTENIFPITIRLFNEILQFPEDG